MNQQKRRTVSRLRRGYRVRNRVHGTGERPRLTVFRSSKHIYAQLVNDDTGETLAAASTVVGKVRESVPYGGNIKAAVAVGKNLAEAAAAKGITKAAFDRGHYRFHGRIKALADAAREGGLQF